MNTEADKRPIIFGEVLLDVFPDGTEVYGGAPFNVAAHLAAFGAAPLLISRIGQDERGRRILDGMKRLNLDRSGVQNDPEHATGAVTVTLAQNEPKFEIEPNAAWDFVNAAQALRAVPEGAGALLYHGSLALRSESSRQALTALRAERDLLVFCDLNLREPWYDAAVIDRCCHAARWLKLNRQELAVVLDRTCDDDHTLETAVGELVRELDLDFAIATMGEAGSLTVSLTGIVMRHVPDKIGDFVDSVGAGDAFSAVCILGLLKQWAREVTFMRAAVFAAEICRIRGAVPTDRSLYDRYRSLWET